MKDIISKPIEGHFKIEQFRDGELIDIYETKNQIMFDSKNIMISAISGMNYPIDTSAEDSNIFSINTFVLGTKGNVDGNLLDPKDIHTDYKNNDLYSLNPGDQGEVYPITFTDSGAGSPLSGIEVDTITEGYDNRHTGISTDNTTVNMKIEEGGDTKSMVYVFEIPLENANGSGGNPIAYTEAALYTRLNQDLGTGTQSAPSSVPDYGYIFAMRTFPAKIKDSTTNFRITWKVIF